MTIEFLAQTPYYGCILSLPWVVVENRNKPQVYSHNSKRMLTRTCYLRRRQFIPPITAVADDFCPANRVTASATRAAVAYSQLQQAVSWSSRA